MSAILIVEDEYETRLILSTVLTLEGYQVMTAANGQEGIERLRCERPALILLDLMMPGMDGWQFRTEQLRDPQLASVPVVLLSAAHNAKQAAIAMGAAGCLGKPIEFDLLLHTIQKTVRQHSPPAPA